MVTPKSVVDREVMLALEDVLRRVPCRARPPGASPSAARPASPQSAGAGAMTLPPACRVHGWIDEHDGHPGVSDHMARGMPDP